MCNVDINSLISPMLTEEELYERMLRLPENYLVGQNVSKTERLMMLDDIYNMYIPSSMSTEIYTKMYLSVIRALRKKCSKESIQLRNNNARIIRGLNTYQGTNAGDCFTVVGDSGIGKSCTIARVIEMIGNEVIEIEEPFFCNVIPVLQVQTPHDCSVKSLLLAILSEVDKVLGSDYYEVAIKTRATLNVLISSVSTICINHVCLLVVDEIQNVIKHRAGNTLVTSLTQLINSSGISLCMVGTPEVEEFFSIQDYLSRRTMGLKYEKLEYNQFFEEFCRLVFRYQYTIQQTEITEGIINWLYEHSGGALAIIIALWHDAQEIAILTDRVCVDMELLIETYQKRMSMVHTHVNVRVDKKRSASNKKIAHKVGMEECVAKKEDEDILIRLAERAKTNKEDVVELLLKNNITVVQITM